MNTTIRAPLPLVPDPVGILQGLCQAVGVGVG